MNHRETAIRFLTHPARENYTHAFRTSATIFRTIVFLFLGFVVQNLQAQNASALIRFDESTRVFRIDAADTTYVLGVNENQQVQTLYWGKHLPESDHFAAAESMPGSASFDPPVNTTPQEFVGWGGGLYVEPDLKITFPDAIAIWS